MSDLLYSPERWRERAEESRRIAEGIRDLEGKRLMIAVAESNERLAERAEQRANKSRD